MKEFSMTNDNHEVVSESFSVAVWEILDSSGTAIITIAAADNYVGKWGMARLWRSWVASCSKFMNDNGATMPLFYDKDGNAHGSRPFNANDGHELFTIKMLGQDEHGNRLSWAKQDHDGMKAANEGQRLRVRPVFG